MTESYEFKAWIYDSFVKDLSTKERIYFDIPETYFLDHPQLLELFKKLKAYARTPDPDKNHNKFMELLNGKGNNLLKEHVEATRTAMGYSLTRATPGIVKDEIKKYNKSKLEEKLEGYVDAKDFASIMKTVEKIQELDKPDFAGLDDLLDRDWTDSINRPLIGYALPGLRELEKKLSGILPGLYLLGAKPHSGKTTLMINIANSLMKSIQDGKEPNGMQADPPERVCFISLDDDYKRIIQRLTAIIIEQQETESPDRDKNKIYTPGDVARPKHIIDKKTRQIRELEKPDPIIKKAYDTVKGYVTSKQLDVQDISKLYSIDNIIKYIETMARETDGKVIFFIDGILNIISTETGQDARLITNRIGSELKAVVDRLNIPVFMNVELRKDNGRGGEYIGLESFRESGQWGYIATVAMFIEPIVKENGDIDQYTIKIKIDKNKNNGELMPWHTMKYKTDHRRGLLDDIGERYTAPAKTEPKKKARSKHDNGVCNVMNWDGELD